MSTDAVERQPGQFARARFDARKRAWLRRVWWVFPVLVLLEIAIPVVLGSILQPGHIGFYSGFGLGVAVAMVILLSDSPPHHIERWRQGAEGERATARALRPLLHDGWELINDIDTGRGNIDHVLIGPAGVFLLESKNLNGLASVHADVLSVRWREDPDDGYEVSQLAPRARAASAKLSRSLAEAGLGRVWVQPVIVLWADFAQRSILPERVAWVQGKSLATVLAQRPARLRPADVARIAAVVRQLGALPNRQATFRRAGGELSKRDTAAVR